LQLFVQDHTGTKEITMILCLDLSSLQKALLSLERALKEAGENSANDLLRDGCIQRFEYTYELAIRMLRRQLESMAGSATEIEQLAYRDLVRMGAEKGLIDDPLAWFDFRNKRNITSHTYDEEKAGIVYGILPEFAKKTRFLVSRLEQYN
jgi:nucleotidyltransferase substrate binding protein (TIGR01987 family)